MYLIIYDKNNGFVLARFDGNQTFKGVTVHFSQKMKENLDFIYVEKIPYDYKNYKIIDGELIRKTEEEINPPLPDPEPSPQELRIQELEKEVENLTNAINTLFGGT